MEYDILRPWETLDQWQKDYIAEKGNCFVQCGRQCGKTTAASIKIAECALQEKTGGAYLVLALTEKQAYNLFFKTLMYLETRHPHEIKRGKDKPTMHEITLKNGMVILCYAAGLTGEGVRTFTIKKLFVDEAAPMSREVFVSITPMLSVTKGTLDVMSTPRGKEGYFYECSKRDDFKKFYVSAEDCPRHSKEFLESEKQNMSELEYAQEYLAQFLDELKRVFSDELIKNICVLKKQEIVIPRTSSQSIFLGVDVAGWGKDINTFSSLDGTDRNNISQVDFEISRKKLTTEVSDRIKELNLVWNYKGIGVDDGGVGWGVFSELLRDEKTKRKTVALNNASRPTDSKGEKSKKLLKEEMYLNLLNYMEKGRIKLFNDTEIIASLKSIQYEYIIKRGRNSEFRIFGNYSHAVESLNRSCWLIKTKGLNLFVHTF